MSIKKQIKCLIPNALIKINKLSDDCLEYWYDPISFKYKKELTKDLTKILYGYDPEYLASPRANEYSGEAKDLAVTFCNSYVKDRDGVADIISAVFLLSFCHSNMDFSTGKNKKMLDEIFALVKSTKENLFKEQEKYWKSQSK